MIDSGRMKSNETKLEPARHAGCGRGAGTGEGAGRALGQRAAGGGADCRCGASSRYATLTCCRWTTSSKEIPVGDVCMSTTVRFWKSGAS